MTLPSSDDFCRWALYLTILGVAIVVIIGEFGPYLTRNITAFIRDVVHPLSTWIYHVFIHTWVENFRRLGDAARWVWKKAKIGPDNIIEITVILVAGGITIYEFHGFMAFTVVFVAIVMIVNMVAGLIGAIILRTARKLCSCQECRHYLRNHRP